MKIFRAIGLGLVIIILKFLTPLVFSGFEKTLLAFFEFAQHFINHLDQGLATT